MSATKLQRLYFRMVLTVMMVLGCGGMMGYITLADPTSQFMSVWVGILTGVLALWANEQYGRKRTGIVVESPGNVDHGSATGQHQPPVIHYVDMSSGTPPPSPSSGATESQFPLDGVRVVS